MMGMKRMVTVQDGVIEWQLVMAGSVLAMLPPILVVVFMQRLFIRGLTETEK
jgi:sn-glycerol 3-phosphate transport system permease protein